MNKFIVINYSSTAQRDILIERINKYADAEIPFHIGRRFLRDYPDSKTLLYSAEARISAFNRQEQVFVAKDKFLVFDGTPVFEGQNTKTHWAERLFRHFRSRSVGQFFTSTFGDYGMVVLRDGVVTAVGDFSGNNPLFHYSMDGVHAISNRQRLLHKILNDDGKVDLDPVALSWLIDQGNVFGTDSPFRGVKLILPSRYAVMTENGITIGGFKRFFVHEKRSDDLSREEVDSAVNSIFKQSELISELPFDDLQMDLTGGMDSRASLAIAIGSGLSKKVTAVKTMGPPGAPDIQVAEALAKEMSLPFEAVLHLPDPNKAVNIDMLWNRLQLNVAITDGTIMAGDGAAGLGRSAKLCLTGGAGEIYRPHVKSRKKMISPDLKRALTTYQHYHFVSDTLGILKPDVIKGHRDYFRNEVVRLADKGVPFEDMHYVFYVEGRMPWWNGYMMSNMMGRIRLNSLANYHAASVMFSTNPEQKNLDRLHFELMKAADPRLLKFPFLANSWDPKMQKYADGHEIALTPMKTEKADTLQNRKPWLFELVEARWDQIFDSVLDNPNSVLFDVIDRAKLEQLKYNKSKMAPGTVRFILTLAQMAILDQETYSPAKQG